MTNAYTVQSGTQIIGVRGSLPKAKALAEHDAKELTHHYSGCGELLHWSQRGSGWWGHYRDSGTYIVKKWSY